MSRHTYYYIQAQKDQEPPQVVGHSQDPETKEVYHRFVDKSRAKSLIKAEMRVSPQYKYRIVKETISIEFGEWSESKPSSPF